MEEVEEQVVFDIQKIMEILPHRYPFLMIDRVTVFEDNVRVVAKKCVTMNEPYFMGHFPGRPVMPGVMLLESMAQAAAILAFRSVDGVIPGKIIFLTGATDVRFKRQVNPGDVLKVEMRSVRKRRPLWIMEGEVTVAGKLVCSATVTAAEAD
jgi:3-hydroxyacyl-[acyl-carrier-protein] dehydratase